MTFRIETIRKGAIVYFSDGTSMGGHFFVSSVSPNHTDSQTISELLAENRTFVPFELEGGEVTLLNKTNIEMVRLEQDELNRQVVGFKKSMARIDFVSGKTKDCSLRFSLPESHSRLSDFLNSCGDFIYVEANGEHFLVQTKAVKRVFAGRRESCT